MSQQNQSQQRGNSSNVSHNPPATNSHLHRGLGHPSQDRPANSTGSHTNVTRNTPYDPQPQGYQHQNATRVQQDVVPVSHLGHSPDERNFGGNVFSQGAPTQVQPQAPTRGNGVPGPSHSNNICKIPDCNQIGFFNPRVQEQLDYCEAHISTALRGYAAACRECGRWPVRENSEYCSRFCASGAGGSSAPIANVPQGFALACQECRRAIMEGRQIYGGRYCSPECYYHSIHSPRR